MEKQQMINTAKERLAPLETGNIIDFIQHFDMKSASEHPLIALLLVILAFYAVIKRSKPILFLLFATVSIMLLVKFTLPHDTAGQEITLSTTLPFIGGGLFIGAALIYLMFISHD